MGEKNGLAVTATDVQLALIIILFFKVSYFNVAFPLSKEIQCTVSMYKWAQF